MIAPLSYMNLLLVFTSNCDVKLWKLNSSVQVLENETNQKSESVWKFVISASSCYLFT